MEPWSRLHNVVFGDRGLDSLRPTSEELVRRANRLTRDGSRQEEFRGVWNVLKQAKSEVHKLDVDDSTKDEVLAHCLDVKAALERIQAESAFRKPSASEGERFAALAFLYAQGKPEDVKIVKQMPNIVESEVLVGRVFKKLKERGIEVEREGLAAEYHEVLLRVQRGVATQAEEEKLHLLSLKLEQIEDDLLANVVEFGRRRMSELKDIRETLARIEDNVRALVAQVGQDE